MSGKVAMTKTIKRIMRAVLTLALVASNGLLSNADEKFQSKENETAANESIQESTEPKSKYDLLDLTEGRPLQVRLRLRRLLLSHDAPTMDEMHGLWKGINTGVIPQQFGFSQFIKDLDTLSLKPQGTNILVHQTPRSEVRYTGWQPLLDKRGNVLREGSFGILPPSGFGGFGYSASTSYRHGNNHPLSPSNLLLNRIVKLDDDHLLGQATIKLGKVHIPVGYFVLERIPVQKTMASIGRLAIRK